MRSLEISLLDHPNPAAFVAEAQKRYPDLNVRLELTGNSLLVEVTEVVPVQITCDIFSFLRDRAQEEIVHAKIYR